MNDVYGTDSTTYKHIDESVDKSSENHWVVRLIHDLFSCVDEESSLLGLMKRYLSHNEKAKLLFNGYYRKVD